MAALTCPSLHDDYYLDHGPTCALTDSSMPAPFLCIPSSISHSGLTDHKLDTIASPLLVNRALPSPLSFVSECKSFYTAFEVTDVDITDSEPPSPETPSFSNDTTDSEEEMQSPIEFSAPASPASDKESPTILSQRSSIQDVKQNSRARRRTSGASQERRSKSQTSDASRSSSISGVRSSVYRKRAGPYRQSLSSRTTVSDHQGKPQHERRDLLALHRESCRLFRSFDKVTNPQLPLPGGGETSRFRPVRSSTEPTQHTHDQNRGSIKRRSSAGSPSHSVFFPSTRPLPFEEQSPNLPVKSNSEPTPTPPASEHAQIPPDANKPAYELIPPTVIDWTSPSTRRREYEKIDRSSRGIRGMWRKLAPKWCQSKSQRLLFFDETKEDKKVYEGSVRRFRMDLPEEDSVILSKTRVIVTEKEPSARNSKGVWPTRRMLWNDDDSENNHNGTKHCFGLRRSSRA